MAEAPAPGVTAGRDGLVQDLQLANEQLVLGALQAEKAADSARAEIDQLTEISQRDGLTGLFNRTQMADRLQSAIAMARRRDTPLALLFIDIDDFKQVNDLLGHDVGDAVLRQVAQCLVASVRESDTVCRYGGDEFLVLLNEVNSTADAAQVAANILARLAEPRGLGDDIEPLRASVGIAMFPQHGTDAAALLVHADHEMYRAKRGDVGLAHGPVPTPPDKTDAQEQRGVGRKFVRQRGFDLVQANERLVLAAMDAMAVEQQVAQAHARHVSFVATVTHELRNPLGPIRNVGLLLSRSYAQDPVLQHLSAILERQSRHLARLIDDLTDGARAGLGRFTLECTRLDLGQLLGPLLEAARESMRAVQQTLTWQLPAQPLMLDGDAVRLRQVFGNLLDNASKYTPEGGAIDLSAAVSGATVRLTLVDNGIGIAAKDLPIIFDLFTQSEQRVPLHRHGLDIGFGIGLAVVRELVQAHSGTVEAHSAGTGEGSSFVVSLPLALDAA